MILATRLQQALLRVAAFASLIVLVCQMATGQQPPPTELDGGTGPSKHDGPAGDQSAPRRAERQ